MPIVKILNRDYSIACGEGEEKKLIELADKLDKRLKENFRLFRGASESLLIMLTAISMEDYISDLEAKIKSLPQQTVDQSNDKELEEALDSLNSRIQNLVAKIK